MQLELPNTTARVLSSGEVDPGKSSQSSANPALLGRHAVQTSVRHVSHRIHMSISWRLQQHAPFFPPIFWGFVVRPSRPAERKSTHLSAEPWSRTGHWPQKRGFQQGQKWRRFEISATFLWCFKPRCFFCVRFDSKNDMSRNVQPSGCGLSTSRTSKREEPGAATAASATHRGFPL